MINHTGQTPCATCPKIPSHVVGSDGAVIEKVPGNYKLLRPHAVELNQRMIAAWQFDAECKAVGQFPNDPIVRANAALIRAAEKEADEIRQSERDRGMIETVLALATMRK